MPSIHELSNAAGFVFQGEVEAVNSYLAGDYQPSQQAIVVRITKIIKAPEALAMYEGHQATVELEPPVSLKKGDSAVFFTNGIHYGETLTVREVGNMPPEPTVFTGVLSAAEAATDNELQQRIATAELIITDVASAPAPYPGTHQPGIVIREHDPDWWQAVVKVESVEKGHHNEATKGVLYAHSTDVAWYKAPKIKEGDRGVFLLHLRDLRGRPTPAHAIVHPLDCQPDQVAERVRAFLKSTPPAQ